MALVRLAACAPRMDKPLLLLQKGQSPLETSFFCPL